MAQQFHSWVLKQLGIKTGIQTKASVQMFIKSLFTQPKGKKNQQHPKANQQMINKICYVFIQWVIIQP